MGPKLCWRSTRLLSDRGRFDPVRSHHFWPRNSVNRVVGFYPTGREFESLRGHHLRSRSLTEKHLDPNEDYIGSNPVGTPIFDLWSNGLGQHPPKVQIRIRFPTGRPFQGDVAQRRLHLSYKEAITLGSSPSVPTIPE